MIDHTYINSGEYRNKFDKISDNKDLNRLIYNLAKRMLYHRSGTQYEDMYWIDIDTLEIVAAETEQKKEGSIKYSKRTRKVIKERRRLLAVHTHPNSMPPSLADINSAIENKYDKGLVICHNGKIFLYSSNINISYCFYKTRVEKYKRLGYDEFNYRWHTLKEYEKQGNIMIKEVT